MKVQEQGQNVEKVEVQKTVVECVYLSLSFNGNCCRQGEGEGDGGGEEGQRLVFFAPLLLLL